MSRNHVYDRYLLIYGRPATYIEPILNYLFPFLLNYFPHEHHTIFNFFYFFLNNLSKSILQLRVQPFALYQERSL